MNTLFQMTDDSQDIPRLFEQAPQEVTTSYLDGALLITLNSKLDRPAESVFCRVLATIPGIKACYPAPANKYSDNTSAILEFQNKVGIARMLEDIRYTARHRAEEFIQSEIDRPAQSTLF